jgi:hypothetical protein
MEIMFEAIKWCRGCGANQPINSFNWKSKERGIRQNVCRVCSREPSRMYYERDRAKHIARVALNNARYRTRNRHNLRELLAAAACSDCGIADFCILEFDHREASLKLDDVSHLLAKAISWSALLAEIQKCDIVCANCHRRRTAARAGWSKLIGFSGVQLPVLPKRGTVDYERIKSVRSSLARRYRNRAYLFEYLRKHPCELCGEPDPVVLDFDHTRDKLGHVTFIANTSGLANLLTEVAKCRVLCANCHRRHTAKTAGRSR